MHNIYIKYIRIVKYRRHSRQHDLSSVSIPFSPLRFRRYRSDKQNGVSWQPRSHSTIHSRCEMWVSLSLYIYKQVYIWLNECTKRHELSLNIVCCYMYHVTPMFRSSIRLLKFIVLLLRWRPTIQIMSTTPTDNAVAHGHQDCPLATNTANNSTTNVEYSLNQEEERVVRCLVWPDRTLLEDILVRYYGTSRDSLYHDDNDEETCRVCYIYSLTHDDVTVSRMKR